MHDSLETLPEEKEAMQHDDFDQQRQLKKKTKPMLLIQTLLILMMMKVVVVVMSLNASPPVPILPNHHQQVREADLKVVVMEPYDLEERHHVNHY